VPCIDFQRRELERQCDFHRNIWKWYLGPLIPGLVVLICAGATANPGHMKYPRLFLVSYSLACAVAFYMIGKWNHNLARKVQSRIDELDAAARQS
jgi:membrane protein DedA with SNARE-associated domain